MKWRDAVLGDLLRVKHGYAFKGEFFAESGPAVLLTPGNFRAQGGLKLKGEKEKFYTGPIPDEFVLRPGDMLVAMTDLTQNAPILGSAAVIPNEGTFLHNQRLGKVVDIDPSKATEDFVYYLFNSPDVRAQIRASATGATVRHTAPDRIYAVRVQLPPLSEQREIARILSRYDALIDNCERRIRILEEMGRVLFREWFVSFRSAKSRTGMVDSPLGRIPRGWTIATIGDVCSRVTDGSHSSPRSVEDGLPMASSKDMHNWGLTLSTARLISRDDFAKLVKNGCQPQKGDVLITKDGANYLKHIFVLRDEFEVVLLSSIAILRPNSRIKPSLLAALIRAPENRRRLRNLVTGAAIPRIILKDFKGFQFVLPPDDVQVAWWRVAEPIEELCWLLGGLKANLQVARDLLLPRLVSGQLCAREVKGTLRHGIAETRTG